MLPLLEKSKSFFLKLSFKRLISGFLGLGLRDKIIFSFLIIAGTIGLSLFSARFYFSNTVLIPESGGVYTEAVISFPRYVNPVIPDQNNAEEILESLVFSSLYKPDGQGGVLPDLAESMTLFEEGKVFLVSLRENIFWHDGEPLTARDVIFTLELLKNQELQNPLADFWKEIAVEILSDKTLKFTLKKSYRFFPFYLTFRIMPEHIWKDTQVNAFVFSEYNLKPIGSGPYKFKKIIQDKDGKVISYGLVAFDKYYAGPYLESFNLKFFGDEAAALSAFRKKEINGLAVSLPGESSNYEMKKILEAQVFSLLFNNSNELLKDFSIRKAINLSINKTAVLSESFPGAGSLTDSAIPLKRFSENFKDVFDQANAKEILLDDGWQDKDEDGFLEKRLSSKTKTVTKLELTILFHDTPGITNVAERIKTDLAAVGISVILKPMGVNEFSSRLQTRSYQMVLLGLSSPIGKEPDLFPFWHSSQLSSPGLNFAVYENKEVDKILSYIRGTKDADINESYEELDALIKNDLPGVFLFQPQINWFVDESFHVPPVEFISDSGVRFSRVNEWYLYLKRVWKR